MRLLPLLVLPTASIPAGDRHATKEETMRRIVVAAALALAMCSSAGISEAQMTKQPYRQFYLNSPLAKNARWLTLHGGVTGTCAGCATFRLRYMSRALVVARFASRGSETTRWALCVVGRESGFNPGAMNRQAVDSRAAAWGLKGHASGLPQIVVFYHRWVNHWRLLHDPAYAVDAMFRASDGGRDRGPWRGGGYSC